MSKKELDANEQSLFGRWLTQTDDIVDRWCNPVAPASDAPDPSAPAPEAKMPHAPTSFERNLEVWRQLWRVTEISQILLVLLDARCPLLHYPPALAAHLATAPIRTILVLTKVDIAGPARADAWARFLHARFPGVRVVQAEAYAHGEPEDAEAGKGKGTSAPRLPRAFRETLVSALRDAHAELLQPRGDVQEDAEREWEWNPRVRREVDWKQVLHVTDAQAGSVVSGAAAPRSHRDAPDEEEGTEGKHEENDEDPEFLTIGLIGQPNVGKSSLLNALFGTHKVKASKTPGKTKHFQTLFWTPEVRLVDCPGLVMPNFVPMEIQVLSGILPISRVSAIPLCIHHAAQLLPLERVLGLTHPALADAPPPDKRTWRAGMAPRHDSAPDAPGGARTWTAMDVLTAYALKKGWVTARTGWPDVNRAGNAVLRALAEGRLRWAFWPPGTDAQTVRAHQGAEPDAGIWIPRADADAESDWDADELSERGDEDEDGDEGGDASDAEYPTIGEEEPESESDASSGTDTDAEREEVERTVPVKAVSGRFAALALDESSVTIEDEGQ